MKSLRLTLLLATLTLLGLTSSAAAQLTVVPDSYSFGKIMQHSVVTKRFFIKNTTSKPVKIKRAQPDCACTDLIVKDSTIRPKDSIAIDVVFHSRLFIGFVSKKPFLWLDGISGEWQMPFFAEVLTSLEQGKPLVMSQKKVDVSQYGEKPRLTATFSFTNNSSMDYKVIEIDAKFKAFDVQLPPVIKAGQKTEGVITIKPDQATTSFEDGFTFQINDDKRSRFTVPVVRTYNPKKAAAKPASGS